MRRVCVSILVSAILSPLATLASQPIVFGEDGSVRGCFPTVPGESVFRFGLPCGPAVKTWREGPALRRQWINHGIQYTQTLLIVPFATAAEQSRPPGSGRQVLLVNVEGQNSNSDYTGASAELILECGNKPQPIELRDGLIRRLTDGKETLVAGFEIPESGLKVTKGEQLQFFGNMPPSLSGSMTLKLPLFAISGDTSAPDALADLLFEEELRRATRAGSRLSEHDSPYRIVFAEEQLVAAAEAAGGPPVQAAVVAPPWFPQPPQLPAVHGRVTTVRSVEDLLAAVSAVGSDETLLVADGRYRLTRPLVLSGKTNVTIRSASGDPRKVILTGKGWDSGSDRDDILRIGRCLGVTIAGLTFADCRSYGVKVEAENAPVDIVIEACHFRNIGVRAIKGSAGNDPAIRAVGGAVRFCYFENTRIPPADWLFGGDYISAIDMMALENWTFSDNVFRNIKGRNGGARAAIFIWVRSRHVTVERNVIVGCDRGIAFGNPGQSTANLPGETLTYVADAVVRNNMIAGGPDCGIELWHVDGVQIAHNSIWRPVENWRRGIRIGTGTRRTEIVNNLVHGEILWEGGQAQVTGNISGKLDGYFVDAASGDLALTASAVRAINQGQRLPSVQEDITRKPRDSRPDPGAWEYRPD